MALTAKQNKQLFYMLCDYIRANNDETSLAYYLQLQATDAFALSEIAIYTTKVIPSLQSQLSTLTALAVPVNTKITALS